MGYPLKTRKNQKRIDREVIIQSRDPLVTDSSATSNIEPGTIWVNKVAGTIYVCTDATIGAAVWGQVGVVTPEPGNLIFLDFDAPTDGDGKFSTPFNDIGSAITAAEAQSGILPKILVSGECPTTLSITGITQETVIDFGNSSCDRSAGTVITVQDNSGGGVYLDKIRTSAPAATVEFTVDFVQTSGGTDVYLRDCSSISITDGAGGNENGIVLWIQGGNTIGVNAPDIGTMICYGLSDSYFNFLPNNSQFEGCHIRVSNNQSITAMTLEKSIIEITSGATVTVTGQFRSINSFEGGSGTLDRSGASKTIQAPAAIAS